MTQDQGLDGFFSRLPIAGTSALVTGGASGIGLSVCQALASAGARVFSADLQEGVATGVPGLSDREIGYLQCDVNSDEDCERAVSHVVRETGRIDILVNCAGIVEKTLKTCRQDMKEWQRVMDVNLAGTFRMSRVAACAMAEAGRGGSIVNVSSVAGLVGFRASNAYGVSKAAVAMLTRTMAADLASDGIRVNAVAPGFIDTPMTRNLDHSTGKGMPQFLARIPCRRFGKASEVALPVVFLCSDWASYITGSVLAIDGGWSAFGGV